MRIGRPDADVWPGATRRGKLAPCRRRAGSVPSTSDRCRHQRHPEGSDGTDRAGTLIQWRAHPTAEPEHCSDGNSSSALNFGTIENNFISSDVMIDIYLYLPTNFYTQCLDTMYNFPVAKPQFIFRLLGLEKIPRSSGQRAKRLCQTLAVAVGHVFGKYVRSWPCSSLRSQRRYRLNGIIQH